MNVPAKSIAPLTLALAALASATSAQTTINVPGDQPTIQSAIAAAVDGDTVLVAPGTYVEQIDFLGRAILVGSSGGPGVTTIDGNYGGWPDQGPGFEAVVRFVGGEGSSSMLRGFKLVQPNDNGLAAPCVWSVGSTPTVIDCVMNGEGIASGLQGDGTFIDCLFEDCRSGPASGQGGAAASDGTFVGCRFLNCYGFGGGGAIHGSPAVIQCEFALNSSGYGNGGAIESTGSAIVVDSVFAFNKTGPDGRYGGAIYGGAEIGGSVFYDNLSEGDIVYKTYGGALAFTGPIDRCTIIANEAWANFPNCNAGSPLGGGCYGGGVYASLVTNSILRGNDPNQAEACSVTYSNVEGGYPGLGNFDVDPGFLNEAGGDFRLRADSLCIDAGDPLAPPDADGTVLDVGAYAFVPALWAPTKTISAAAGGAQNFEVHAGTLRSGDLYWVLGSATGTEPGIPLDSWLLPLVPDAWFAYTLGAPNGPLLPGSLGTVPASGIAAASLVLPAGLDPGLVGASLHHAFATLDTTGAFAVVSGTSDAFDVTFTP